MDNKIREEVKLALEGILASKEESEIKTRMEEALTDAKETISSLNQDVADKEAAIAVFSGDIETKDASIVGLEEKVKELEIAIESLTKEKDGAEGKASTLETELAEIKKEQTADIRLAKIIEAKLIRETEEVKDKTKVKVKEMSDEDFNAYIEDLSEVRNSFLEELKKQEDAKDDDDEDPEGDPNKETCECKKDECEKCNPDKKNELAALNIESIASDDLKDTYKNAFKKAGLISEE